MKKPLTSAALLAISTAFYPTPGFCIDEIEEWQKYIKQEQAGGPQFAENVAGATLCLAQQYQRYGMIKQADETFEKALELHKRLAVLPEKQRFLGIYISWAQTLLKGRLPSRSRDRRELRYQATETTKADFPRIDAVLRKAWNDMTSSEDPTKLKPSNFFYVAGMFQETGNKVEMEKCERYLLRICERIEREENPTKEQVKWATEVLNGLCYAIFPESRTIPRRNEIEVLVSKMKAVSAVSAPVSSKETKTSTTEYWKLTRHQRAEVMRLKALALIDRCESDENARIEAHRNMALWYLSAGKSQEAVEQTKVLADLMGVKEAFLLFPIPQGCHGGCGTG